MEVIPLTEASRSKARKCGSFPITVAAIPSIVDPPIPSNADLDQWGLSTKIAATKQGSYGSMVGFIWP
jgi:hypothetical protein